MCPSAAALIIKALKEPHRDRKKVFNENDDNDNLENHGNDNDDDEGYCLRYQYHDEGQACMHVCQMNIPLSITYYR